MTTDILVYGYASEYLFFTCWPNIKLGVTALDGDGFELVRAVILILALYRFLSYGL